MLCFMPERIEKGGIYFDVISLGVLYILINLYHSLADSANDKLIIFFSPGKIGYDISYKLSRRQILFSGKNKKNSPIHPLLIFFSH